MPSASGAQFRLSEFQVPLPPMPAPMVLASQNSSMACAGKAGNAVARAAIRAALRKALGMLREGRGAARRGRCGSLMDTGLLLCGTSASGTPGPLVARQLHRAPSMAAPRRLDAVKGTACKTKPACERRFGQSDQSIGGVPANGEAPIEVMEAMLLQEGPMAPVGAGHARESGQRKETPRPEPSLSRAWPAPTVRAPSSRRDRSDGPVGGAHGPESDRLQGSASTATITLNAPTPECSATATSAGPFARTQA